MTYKRPNIYKFKYYLAFNHPLAYKFYYNRGIIQNNRKFSKQLPLSVEIHVIEEFMKENYKEEAEKSKRIRIMYTIEHSIKQNNIYLYNYLKKKKVLYKFINYYMENKGSEKLNFKELKFISTVPSAAFLYNKTREGYSFWYDLIENYKRRYSKWTVKS